jgi:hypothetical protein
METSPGEAVKPPYQESRRPNRLSAGRDDESQRLAAEMDLTWQQAKEACRQDPDGHHGRIALRLVERAAEESGAGRREAAWMLSLAAHRELIHVSSDSERKALMVSIGEQAEKLSSDWRRKAVERLTTDPQLVCDAAALVEAVKHIDEAGSNQARGQRILRRELGILGVILLVAVAMLTVLLVVWLPLPGASGISGLATDQLALLAVLFGVVGACMSSIQRTTSTRTQRRVPGMRAAMWASFTRPLIGAAAGLVVWALAVDGVLSNESVGFLGLAFAAGFSERVILRYIPVPSDTDREPDGPNSKRKGRAPTEGGLVR